MSSQAQTDANRQNSQKSTGPRSIEGKAASSRNALKTGLFAASETIRGDASRTTPPSKTNTTPTTPPKPPPTAI